MRVSCNEAVNTNKVVVDRNAPSMPTLSTGQLKWRLGRRNAVLSKPSQYIVVVLVVISDNPVVASINLSRVSNIPLILRGQSIVVVEGEPVAIGTCTVVRQVDFVVLLYVLYVHQTTTGWTVVVFPISDVLENDIGRDRYNRF